MKKPKLILKIVLMSVISLLLVTSIMLSTMLGSVNAKLYKKLLKSLDFEVVPDLAFSYYLKDDLNPNGTTGTYKDTKNISQTIKLGADIRENSVVKRRAGQDVIYQIKIPVDEVGYYTLSFTVDFLKHDKTTDAILTGTSGDVRVRTFETPVGCQVLHPYQLDFASGKIYSMAPGSTTEDTTTDKVVDDNIEEYAYDMTLDYGTSPLLEAYNHYQWKTLAPSRAERVDLSFSVEEADIAASKGYVVWTWDFKGLTNSTKFTLSLSDISIVKNKPNDSSKPYFEFMNTQYVNNTITVNQDSSLNTDITGVNTPGYTRPLAARGTYVTSGTHNSLAMQASPLFEGWDTSKKSFVTGALYVEEIGVSEALKHSNLIAFNVPIKNVQKNVSYRVSFDFSLARQGVNNDLNEESDPPTYTHGGLNYNPSEVSDVDYSSNYDDMFNDCDYESSLHFESYLHSGPVLARDTSSHTNATCRAQITMANKQYPAHEVTRYDEIMSVASSNNKTTTTTYTTQSVAKAGTHAKALNGGVTESVNTADNLGSGVNWYNAIKHTEINGENEIHWLTFYNTTFTFNIDPNDADVKDEDNDGYCDELFWTWAIDALEQTAWFRIKIENVRIEPVEQYGSYFDANGMYIGDLQCQDFYPNGNETIVNGDSVGETFRNANGTGQNYQARGYAKSVNNLLNQAATNIFGAIYDAGDQNVNGDYKIKLSGYCTVKGGVDKYVWSADGGKTWFDMTGGTIESYSQQLDNGTASDVNYVSKYCEKFVDQGRREVVDLTAEKVGDTYDQYGYSINDIPKVTAEEKSAEPGDFVDFDRYSDDINSRFINIVADLSEYRYQRDLDIIFAAVPVQNPSARCEILRVINYNSSKQYRTNTLEFESDFELTISNANTKLNATYNKTNSESNVAFTEMSGVKYSKSGSTVTKSFAKEGGYSWRTDTSSAYEDVRILYSNMPVKNTLTVRGWAIVEDGVEAYMWSVDKGKNWNTCEQRGTSTSSADTDLDTQYTSWYSPDGSGSLSDDLKQGAYFDGADNGLIIDLTDYVGKVVDLIVVAKPTGSDALCPVSRIDNVAVYGAGEKDRGMGLFYSEISYLAIGSSVITNQVTTYPDGVTALNGGSQWNIGLKPEALTVYEPYNVDVLSTRLYNQDVHNISNGGTVTIGGAIACNRGVAKYKYSIDGGAWKEFSGSVVNCASGSTFVETVQKTTDKSFTVADTADYSNTMLSLTLPTNISGERELLVVAEGNNGYLYPILHVKLNIAKAN